MAIRQSLSKSQAGVAGAQPMRGESEGSPLSYILKSTAEQTDRDAQPSGYMRREGLRLA
jgi:hypothetical protein